MGRTTASNDQEKERLAAFIKEIRGSRSQRFYAKLLNVSYTAIQEWEGCRSFPGKEHLKGIATTAGWSIQELENYLTTGKKPTEPAFEMLLSQIKGLSPEQLLQISRAVDDRLAELLKCSQASTPSQT